MSGRESMADLPPHLWHLFEDSASWPCAACLRSGLPPCVTAFWIRPGAAAVPYVVCRACARDLEDPKQRRILAERIEQNLEPSGPPS